MKFYRLAVIGLAGCLAGPGAMAAEGGQEAAAQVATTASGLPDIAGFTLEMTAKEAMARAEEIAVPGSLEQDKGFPSNESEFVNYYCKYAAEIDTLPGCSDGKSGDMEPILTWVRLRISAYEQIDLNFSNRWNGHKLMTVSYQVLKDDTAVTEKDFIAMANQKYGTPDETSMSYGSTYATWRVAGNMVVQLNAGDFSLSLERSDNWERESKALEARKAEFKQQIRDKLPKKLNF